MEKYYEFYEFSQRVGNTTVFAIVTNLKFEDGVMTATKVGELDDILSTKDKVYCKCEPVKFIAGGGPYILEEYKKALMPQI